MKVKLWIKNKMLACKGNGLCVLCDCVQKYCLYRLLKTYKGKNMLVVILECADERRECGELVKGRKLCFVIVNDKY